MTVAALLTGCSGGGGGGSGKSRGELLAVTFPDPLQVNATSTQQSPAASPLNQEIRFEFSATPRLSEVGPESIQIRDAQGLAVPGDYRVTGSTVSFLPRFPDRPVTENGVATTDNGGAGLRPGESYSIRVGPDTWPFVQLVAKELRQRFPDPADDSGVYLVFRTTDQQADYFRGIVPKQPRLRRVDPADGSFQVTPQLFTDPDGVFPPRRSFTLEFDAPVHPSEENLAGFRLVDLEADLADYPAGLPLAVDVSLRSNGLSGAMVEIMPSGILPFGHLLSLEYPAEVRGLSQSLVGDSRSQVAATFTVAEASRATIVDLLEEDFDDRDRMNVDPSEFRPGEVPANWDVLDSDVLTANFAFDGAGELGPFTPPPPADGGTRLVVLDTSIQELPLLDGSTPEAPRTRVVGGVFSFTDIEIPEGVILEPRGPNPLILNATGSVRIAGEFEFAGQDGRDENSFDSSVTSLPGGSPGPGGGRGGEGQPIWFVGPRVSNRTLVSPPFGGRGWGDRNRVRNGGGGGQSGSIDHPDEDGRYQTDRESSCNELNRNHNPGFKPPGGGGGSYLRLGREPISPGIGNILVDGLGNFILRTPESDGPGYLDLIQGAPGQGVFVDENPNNDFIGFRGEVQTILGGQGGGAGGSGVDAYYCGKWCRADGNGVPGKLCMAEFGINSRFADSVGDSRGGSGGGGGGAFWIKALGPITLESTARIRCNGGRGGGGEPVGCGGFSGCGGGGSGGAALFQSAVSILVEAGAEIDVRGGRGVNAVRSPDRCMGQRKAEAPGSSGAGGRGIIQLQVPRGTQATVEDRDGFTSGAWVDIGNNRNPSEFTPISVAISQWFDMGRVTQRPPRGTNPVFSFRGTDEDGKVRTDGNGNVLQPARSDIRVDFLGVPDPSNPGGFLPGLAPRANFIPTNAEVTVEFQGGEAASPGSKEVATETEWAPTPTIASGKQFLRYRIRFDLTANGGSLDPDTPKPTVQKLTIRAEF